jgi:hypothetical protein
MNTLKLIQKANSSSLRHGGVTQEYRNFDLLINDVVAKSFRDDSPAHDYARGPSLDAVIDRQIETLEKCLGCKCQRPGKVGPDDAPFLLDRLVELRIWEINNPLNAEEQKELASLDSHFRALERPRKRGRR